MENIKLQKLTEQERMEAEKNHSLVYSFLHRHKYSIEDFYNVVIFGYLKGIQVYFRREDLQEKFQLAFICEQYMRAEIGNHFKMENSQKRRPTETIISLDSDYAEDVNFYNCIGGKSSEAEVMEMLFVKELMDMLTESQRKIVELKVNGYNNSETCMLLEMPSSTFYKEMQRIKGILGNIVG